MPSLPQRSMFQVEERDPLTRGSSVVTVQRSAW